MTTRTLIAASLMASMAAPAAAEVATTPWSFAQPAQSPSAASGSTCMGLPRIKEGQSLVVLSESHGGYLSTSASLDGKGYDEAASVTFVDVEAGEGGIVAVLESNEPTVFAFRGAVDRIDRVVLVPMISNVMGTVPANRNGVVNLPAAKVSLAVGPGCLPPTQVITGRGRDLPRQGLADAWGAQPVAVVTGGTFGQVSFPSGQAAAEPRQPAVAKRDARFYVADIHPDGVADIDPASVVALRPFTKPAVLPGLAGILDMEAKGKASEVQLQRGTGYVDVSGPGELPLWGEDVSRYMLGTYIRAGAGVTVPPSWEGRIACVLSSDGHSVVSGLRFCRDRGWTDAATLTSTPSGNLPPVPAGCPIPVMPSKGKVVAMLDDPQHYTDYALGDDSMPTHVERIVVEPGEGPVTIFSDHDAAGSFKGGTAQRRPGGPRRVVYAFEGDTARVAAFVSVSDAKPTDVATAVLGLQADRVSIVASPGCPVPGENVETTDAGPFLAAVAAAVGRTPDTLVKAPKTGDVALPSGARPAASDASRTRPFRCGEQSTTLDVCSYAYQGYLSVPPGPFVPAGIKAVALDVQPGPYGIQQLEREGTLTRMKVGRGGIMFRVNADAKLPSGLCPVGQAFVIPQGVTPVGHAACSCLVDEVTMKPLAGQAPNACSFWSNQLAK